ncbi:MAG: CrcB family protein [Mycobacteriaceae bacterium]|nr:CrcB family protein [Mycobacteriaceae bacterium]
MTDDESGVHDASARVVDPDVDLRDPAQRGELAATHGAVVVAVSVGGGVGALARYGIALLLPTRSGGFPWATFITNLTGCFLIGVLMVVITEIVTPHPLLRPLLGVGVLGGFTTFSTYAVESRDLLRPGTIGVGFGYLAATLVCCLVAVTAAAAWTRALAGRARRRTGAAA